jgi:hypothetical protein
MLPNKRMQQTARRGFKRKAVAVMSLVRFASRSASRSWGGITPQLMRKAVRRRPAVWDSTATG